MITLLVAQSPSPSSLVLPVFQPHSNWHWEDHPIISNRTPISSIMQELMDSITHWWSHSWYRSKYCPSLIVQDSGDTTINGTVPIYFQAFPDLCHHVGRGINPCSRAVTYSLLTKSFTDVICCSFARILYQHSKRHMALDIKPWQLTGSFCICRGCLVDLSHEH